MSFRRLGVWAWGRASWSHFRLKHVGSALPAWCWKQAFGRHEHDPCTEHNGFARIVPFGGYVGSPLSVCMAKDV
jgi:hypothetical protein